MKYLIYQNSNLEVKRREIKNLEGAEEVVKLSKGKPVKIDGEYVTIVGIGTDEDYRAFMTITHVEKEPTIYFEKLRDNVAYYKEHGEWPKE